jgi:hypothetical protein
MVLAAGGLSLRPFEGNHDLILPICRLQSLPLESFLLSREHSNSAKIKFLWLSPLLKSPQPPFAKGSREEIERREAKASFVARGRGNFLPSKPGGRYMAVKHCPGFRRATSAGLGNSNKSKQRVLFEKYVMGGLAGQNEKS